MTNNSNNSSKLTFVDLFSGAGGFSLGFVQEGFKDLMAVEIDKEPVETYSWNFPQSAVILEDIRKLHSLEILDTIEESPDVIIASPPCEPFSAANPNRLDSAWSRFYEDPQGDLIFHAIRLIGDLSPKIFVIENVVPMINQDGKDILKAEFQKVGYEKIFFNIINAENHGCPSIRKRVFISNIHISLPKKKSVTVVEALKDLPSPSEPNDIPNHTFTHFPQKVSKKADKIRPGIAAVFFRGAKLEHKNWIKLKGNENAPTVMGKSKFIHPTETRALTTREQARLMSYPDDFEFRGSHSSTFNQIGESVPPVISRLIAQKIKEKMIRKK
ncbi:MAG: DNA cytosine methyltransferase [Candidatus Heimdallarchaeaceae archaeon]|jgi:DNA (cytosine-5)-methyltransferase 1